MSFIDEKSTTPKLLKNGFLVKKGGAKDSLLESWQKRWFTLKYKPLSETHEIEYFKNNNVSTTSYSYSLHRYDNY